jgi:hypothetical protein
MTEPADAVAGDADRFSFNIERISIGDRGDAHTLGGVGSVTVIVGANNVGKTTVLAQIREMLFQPCQLTRTSDLRVVTQLDPHWTGGQDDVEGLDPGACRNRQSPGPGYSAPPSSPVRRHRAIPLRRQLRRSGPTNQLVRQPPAGLGAHRHG